MGSAADLPVHNLPRIGCLVPASARAQVVSTHPDIVNLRVEDDEGAFIVTLLWNQDFWTELSLAAPPDLPQDRYKAGLWTRWDAQPGPGASRPVSDVAPATLRALRTLLLDRYPRTGMAPLLHDSGALDDPVCRRARRALAEPDAAAAGRHTADTPLQRATRLAGLGIGLTPSGDDFISGVALSAWRGGATPGSLAPDETAALTAALPRTTAAGASLLRLVRAGHPPQWQLTVLQHLAAGNTDAALHLAAGHGHSSGVDTLAGLVWADEFTRSADGHG